MQAPGYHGPVGDGKSWLTRLTWGLRESSMQATKSTVAPGLTYRSDPGWPGSGLPSSVWWGGRQRGWAGDSSHHRLPWESAQMEKKWSQLSWKKMIPVKGKPSRVIPQLPPMSMTWLHGSVSPFLSSSPVGFYQNPWNDLYNINSQRRRR